MCAYAQISGVGYNAVVCDTDVNGHYSLGVVNGDWQVYLPGPGGSDSLPGCYIYPPGQSVAILNNGGTANFIAPLATQSIYGSVKDSSGNPIAGVGVGASATINSVDYGVYADTDGNGNYTLNVAAGALGRQPQLQRRERQPGQPGQLRLPGRPVRHDLRQQWDGEFHGAVVRRHFHQPVHARRRGWGVL